MKESIKSIAVNSGLCAGVIADHLYGVSAAGNVSMFWAWLAIVLVLIIALIPSSSDCWEGVYKKDDGIKWAFILPVLTFAACGWFVTASAYFIAAVISKAKRASVMAELEKGETDEQ